MTATAVRPIRNDNDLEVALARLDDIWEAEPDTPLGDEREVLASLIHEYERSHYPVGPSDPVEAIFFHMDRLGLKQSDLVPYLGARSRVSEILGRKRALTVNMIRALHHGLGIPLESLVGEHQGNGRFTK